MGRAFHAGGHGHAVHRRDSHGSEIKNNVPEGMDDNKMNFIHNNPGARLDANAKAADVETVESVVYVTMPQTFEGDAGMSTDGAATSTMDAADRYRAAKGMAGQPQTAAASSEATTTASPSLQTVSSQVSAT